MRYVRYISTENCVTKRRRNCRALAVREGTLLLNLLLFCVYLLLQQQRYTCYCPTSFIYFSLSLFFGSTPLSSRLLKLLVGYIAWEWRECQSPCWKRAYTLHWNRFLLVELFLFHSRQHDMFENRAIDLYHVRATSISKREKK